MTIVEQYSSSGVQNCLSCPLEYNWFGVGNGILWVCQLHVRNCMQGPVTQVLVESGVLFYQWAGEDLGALSCALMYIAQV